MEEKYGVSIKGVYAEYESIDDDSYYINVRAEMLVVDGTNIEEDLSIVMPAVKSLQQIVTILMPMSFLV